MPGNSGTADSSLIARGCNDNHAALGGMIKSLF
jgi:hypothetical protein